MVSARKSGVKAEVYLCTRESKRDAPAIERIAPTRRVCHVFIARVHAPSPFAAYARV